jgi:hypothetical protein
MSIGSSVAATPFCLVEEDPEADANEAVDEDRNPPRPPSAAPPGGRGVDAARLGARFVGGTEPNARLLLLLLLVLLLLFKNEYLLS